MRFLPFALSLGLSLAAHAQLWDVPGNAPTFPATAQPRTLTSPRDAPARFFRLRFSVP